MRTKREAKRRRWSVPSPEDQTKEDITITSEDSDDERPPSPGKDPRPDHD